MTPSDQCESRSDGECLFCGIAAGTVPSHPVYEDAVLFAFLDIHPIRPGHLQIIPREHFPYFDDLPPAIAARIVHLGQRLAAVLKEIYASPRAGFAFTGGDIAHVHAHVVPLFTNYDITSRSYIVEQDVSFRPPPQPPNAELEDAARRIRSLL